MRYLDPIDQFSISNYAAFANNPIINVDPLGLAAGGFGGKIRQFFTGAKRNLSLRKYDKSVETKTFKGRGQGPGVRAPKGMDVPLVTSDYDNTSVTTGRNVNGTGTNRLFDWVDYYTKQLDYQSHTIDLKSMDFGKSQMGDSDNKIAYQFDINNEDYAAQVGVNGIWDCGQTVEDGFTVCASTLLTDYGITGGTAIETTTSHEIELTLTAYFQRQYKYETYARFNGANNYTNKDAIIMAPMFRGGAPIWNGGYLVVPKIYRNPSAYQRIN